MCLVLQIWCVLLLFECQLSEIVWQVKILCVSSWNKPVIFTKKQNKLSLLTFVPEAPDDVGRRRGAAVVVESVVQFQHVLGWFGAGPRPGPLIRPVQHLQKLTQNLLHVHFIHNTWSGAALLGRRNRVTATRGQQENAEAKDPNAPGSREPRNRHDCAGRGEGWCEISGGFGTPAQVRPSVFGLTAWCAARGKTALSLWILWSRVEGRTTVLTRLCWQVWRCCHLVCGPFIVRPGSSHFLYLLSMHAFLRRPAQTYALGTFTFTLSRRTESALASPLRSKDGKHVIKNKKKWFLYKYTLKNKGA